MSFKMQSTKVLKFNGQKFLNLNLLTTKALLILLSKTQTIILKRL